MPFFTDDVFKGFVSQFKSQDFDGWEQYVQISDFTVYRKRSDRNAHLFKYRAVGGWSNVHPATLAHVYLDLAFRKKWDKNMLSYHITQVQSGYTGYQFEMKYPWPLSNRDYAYAMETKMVQDGEGNTYQVILGESLEGFPEGKKGVIRIDTYMQNICIAADGDNGCTVFMDYFDDPKGGIPKSVINWAAKTGIPTFIENLKSACVQYNQENPTKSQLEDMETLFI
ncbi:hypothetical protein MFLAVUS_002073 [Mucor flavus]|uniref:START domain-containing protein n=1 Tax=Mucor flavus TaxID=439312 RepID=A0ABP9YP84_9FUNG